jgi:K+-sensing histidine kinase KdpD
VAHDLRDPLATVKLGLDRITTLKVGPEEIRTEIRTNLPLFRRQVERMERMISDLAEITMAEYGQLSLSLSLAELSLG